MTATTAATTTTTATTVRGPSTRIGRIVRLGLLSGKLEIRAFFRNTTAVVFGLLFPALLMVLFATIFNDQIQGTGVTIAQYMAAGIIAISVATVAFSNLGIAVATERSEGRIKRLAGSPLPVGSYFLGKIVAVVVNTILGIGILVAIAIPAYGLDLPADGMRCAMFVATVLLGLTSCTLLGIAIGTVPPNGRTAPGIITPAFVVLQFISGTFLQFTTQPGWLKRIANLFPLRWMALGMRSALLPEQFVSQETGQTWQRPTVLVILVAWIVGGALLARWRFTWRDGE